MVTARPSTHSVNYITCSLQVLWSRINNSKVIFKQTRDQFGGLHSCFFS